MKQLFLPASATALHAIRRLAVRAWSGLRRVAGDDAYERYLEHHDTAHPGRPFMTRRDFYQQRTDRKWSGISRCC